MAAVRELEEQDLPFEDIRRKYGIKGNITVQKWVRKYGNGSRGKVIRVQRPEEISELKRLKDRVRRLETALADANIEAALERAYTKLACERAGVEAGLSATGDIFDAIAKRAGTTVAALSEGLEMFCAGQTGLLRLTWDNGDRTVLVNLSGRGDKDMHTVANAMGIGLHGIEAKR